MKKQPILQCAGATRITKGLLIMSFALLQAASFAQTDVNRTAEYEYRQLESQAKPWHFENRGGNKPASHPLTVKTERRNIAVIDELYIAFAKGDIPAALADMDPNIEWNEAESFPYADGNPYIGPQAVVEGVFARIGEEWEYWNLTGIELHEMSNDKVLATLRYQAKYKKNGEEIDAQTAHFWTLKDGKITHFQQFTDTDQVVRAVQK